MPINQLLPAISATREIESLKLDLAAELAPNSWHRQLRRFSKLILSGKAWDDAVQNATSSRQLQGMLRAVRLCPDPIETLCELLRAKRRSTTVSQAVKPLSYPAMLLIATFVITSGMSWVGVWSTRGLEWIDWRSGRKEDLISRLFLSQWLRSIGMVSLVGWFTLVAAIILLLGAPLTKLNISIKLPVFGKLMRFSMFRDLLQSFAAFLASGVSTEKALTALEECYRGTLLGIPARGLGRRIRSGVPMDQAIHDSVLCDSTLRPAARSLMRAEDKTSLGLQSLAALANHLFEQRRSTLYQVGRRVGFLLVVCMFVRIGVDVALEMQAIDWTTKEFEFYGFSENWMLLFPLAVVNFVFLNSMFPSNRNETQGIKSFIKLLSAIFLMVALAGMTVRLTFADLLYLVPLTMAVMALRANHKAMNRYAATSSLMFGANRHLMPERIADDLVVDNTGQVRRRVKKFSDLLKKGASFGAAISRSRLVTDDHERWLVALVTGFGNMSESQSILSQRSPWSQLSIGLRQRLNAIKWTSIVFSICLWFFVIFEFFFIWQVTSGVLKEFGISDEFTQNVFPIDSIVNKELQTFVLQELRGPSSILFVFILFGPVVLLLIVNQLTFLKRWIVDFWMSPIYRAWTLRGISEVLQSDERLVSVLRESSKIHPLNGLRKRISRLVGNIESGMAVQDAFHRSGLISRSQRELIALAKKPSQLAWTLRQIADRNFFRWIEWYSMCMDVFALLMVLVTAVVVGFFAYIQFQLFAYVITWGAR
ncbi:MAG: hypothetical protein NTY15_06750 [Planctomycetota bacterium]|nr:hypothetical protein [Planctomycetota bacterium]